MGYYNDFIMHNIAPYAAKKIGVYDSNGQRVGSIPLDDFKPSYGERLYRFGILSDVHNQSSQTTENDADLRNALSFFNNKESVEFTVISGDLTETYSNAATELAKFQTNVNSLSPKTPVYPTTGNHDCPSTGNVDIARFYSYTDSSQIAPSTGADYSYEITKTHQTSDGRTVTDHFLFLTMKTYQFSTNTYSETDLTWLANKLEAYKNDRCFVITHMFIPTYAGNFKQIYPTGNWLSGTMLTRVKNLVDSYPRSIWFSGHSHWKWYLQKYEQKANLYPLSNIDRTIGWTSHIPSCASPIDSDGVSTRVSMATQSEGAIIDVYEDYIDIRAIAFKSEGDSTYTNKYLPIGQYRLYTAPSSSGGGTVQAPKKRTLLVKLDGITKGVGLGNTYTARSTVYLKYDDIRITDGTGTDVTSSVVVSGVATTNNSYGCGAYNVNSKYQYTPANEVLSILVNEKTVTNSNGSTAPIVQSSSSSNVSATNPLYIQLYNMQVSTDNQTWTEVNEDSVIANGSSWNKADCQYAWLEGIIDNPETYSFS